MKRITGVFLYMLCMLSSLHAQNKGLYIKGAKLFFINESTELFINGHFQADSLKKDSVSQNMLMGKLKLKGSIYNKTGADLFSFRKSKGRVIFMGDTNQYIAGDSLLFSSIELANKAKLILLDSISSDSGFYFTSGHLDLNNKTLRFWNKREASDGTLYNESETSHVLQTPGKVLFEGFSNDDPQTPQRLKKAGLDIGNSEAFPVNNYSRFHLPTANITDTSIAKSFRIENKNTQAGEISLDLAMNYFDPHDLTTKAPEEKFHLWYTADNNLVWYKKIRNSIANPTNNSVKNGSPLKKKTSRIDFTIAPADCDSLPPMFMDDTIPFCKGSSVLISVGEQSLYKDCDIYWYAKNGKDTAQQIKKGHTYMANAPQKLYTHIINLRGCENYDSVTIVEKPAPSANIFVNGNQNGYYCGGQQKLETKLKGGNFTEKDLNYSWHINGTQVSNQASFERNMPIAGTYQVKLSLKDKKYQCTSITSEKIEILQTPTTKLATNTACSATGVEITHAFTAANSFVKEVKWQFGQMGDSSKTYTQNEYHSGKISKKLPKGQHKIKVSVKNEIGCMAKDSITAKVYSQPKAKMALHNDCQGSSTQLENLSSISDGAIKKSTWYINGKKAQEGQGKEDQFYTFTKAGQHKIKLKVESYYGCTDTLSQTIEIYPLPRFEFQAHDTCAGNKVNFKLRPEANSPVANKYEWHFGDGSSVQVQNPQHTYAKAGTYETYVKAYVLHGAKTCTVESQKKKITIHPLPQGIISANNTCWLDKNRKPKLFIAKASLKNGELFNSLTYNWQLGDGEKAQGQQISHTYSQAGKYDISLEIKTEKGCTQKIKKEDIQIFTPPIFDLGGKVSTCSSQKDLKIIGTGILSYQWSTGETTPQIKAKRNGLYWGEAKDNKGCIYRDSVNLVLHGEINIDLGKQTKFCGQAKLNAGNPGAKSYTWFKDGSKIFGANKQYHTAKTSGEYKIKITDEQGCTGEASIQATINPLPTTKQDQHLEACEGQTINLKASTGQKYWWNEDKTNQATLQLLNKEGKHSVTIWNSHNCQATENYYISLNKSPEIELGQNIEACDQATLKPGKSFYSYTWSNGSTQDHLTVKQSGTYWVKASTNSNCHTYDTIQVSIKKSAPIDLGQDISICEGENVRLQAGAAAESYQWSNGSKGPEARFSTQGYASLTATKGTCTSHDSVYITVNSKPYVNLGDNLFLCQSEKTVLFAPQGAIKHKWGNSNGLVSSKEKIRIKESGTYWLTVTNAKGCSNSDTIKIEKSKEELTASFLVATEIYVGDTLQFSNLSYPAPYTSKWLFGNGYTSNETDPLVLYKLPGQYNVSLQVSNTYCTGSLEKSVTIKSREEKNKKAFGYLNLGQKNLKISLLELFPNPVSEKARLKIETLEPMEIKLHLYDLQGNLLKQKRVKCENSVTTVQEFDNLTGGAYLLQVIAGNDSRTIKIILVK